MGTFDQYYNLATSTFSSGANLISNAGTSGEAAAVEEFSKSFINSIMTIVGNNAEKSAKETADTNEKEAREIEDVAETALSKTYQNAQTIIDNALYNIQELNEILEVLDQTNLEIKNKKDEINRHRQTIENGQATLNNPSASEEEKSKAFKEIKDASSAIFALGEDVALLAASSNNLNSQSESLINNTQDLQTEGQEILETGEQELGVVISRGNEQITGNLPQAMQQGAQYTAQGVALEASAKGSSVIPFGIGTVASANLEMRAQDYLKGASELTSRTSITIGQIQKTFSYAYSGIQSFGVLNNTLGNYSGLGLEKYTQFTNNFEPMITTFASWQDVISANRDLESILETDQTLLEQGISGETSQFGSGDNPEGENPELEVVNFNLGQLEVV